MSISRFATVNEETLKQLTEQKDAKNTQRTVKRSVSLFREFLGAENSEFESLSNEALNEQLRLFYASIRSKTGGDLKTSTLHNIKYGLVKYLKETCQIDVYNDSVFNSSNAIFKAVVTDLKKKGLGSIEHKPPISDIDLKKLYRYDNVALNTETPCGLQFKVWFDLMYFLCRRGRENLREMKKSTFAVKPDTSGLEYVCQIVDEADKNHRSVTSPDDTVGEGRMYARPESVMCPVSSFKKYLEKLHPDIDDLWQRPLDSYNDSDLVWYYKSPLGKNTLAGMMTKISKLSKLSVIYTNHSIRATTITALDDAGVEARHIMRASGHKSESSIRSYSCRLSENKKREMSTCLSNALEGSERQNEANSSTSMSDMSFLSNEELDTIFNHENEFMELSIPVNTSPTGSVPSTESIQSNPPKVLNQVNQNMIRQNPVDFNSSGFQICPTMNRCVVNFNFYQSS